MEQPSKHPFFLDEHSSTSMLDHVTEQTNIDSMLRYRPSVSMVYYRPRVISRSWTNWRRSISSFKKSFWWFAALIFKLNSFIFELCLLLCWIIRPCHTLILIRFALYFLSGFHVTTWFCGVLKTFESSDGVVEPWKSPGDELWGITQRLSISISECFFVNVIPLFRRR